jgi:integrase
MGALRKRVPERVERPLLPGRPDARHVGAHHRRVELAAQDRRRRQVAGLRLAREHERLVRGPAVRGHGVRHRTTGQASGTPTWSPHDLRHRRISLWHRQGETWALIGVRVGQRSLSVTADTYTHVLLDNRELDHARLVGELAERVTPA